MFDVKRAVNLPESPPHLARLELGQPGYHPRSSWSPSL